MTRAVTRLALLLALLCLIGCGDDDTAPADAAGIDAATSGTPDAGRPAEAGMSDAGQPVEAGIPSAETSQLMAITAARSIRLYQAFGQTLIDTVFEDDMLLQYHGNLYSRTDVEGRVSTVSFFSDGAGTVGAGTMVATASNDDRSFPVTFDGVVNVTAGARPATGTFTLTFADNRHLAMTGDATITTGTGMYGTFVVHFEAQIDFDMRTLRGSAIGMTGGSTLTLTNLFAMGNDPFTGSIHVAPANATADVSITVDKEGVGSLTLSDGTTATWDSPGAGTVTLPGGTNVPVTRVDSGE